MRPFGDADVDELVRAIGDDEIARWLDIVQPYTADHAQSFVDRTPTDWDERRGAHFAIARDGDFAGYLGVLAVEEGMRVVEIMYWVAASHRGHALAARALATVIPWVTSTIAPERIELGMKAGNGASARTAEANGFTIDRIERDAADLDGSPVDELIYTYRLVSETER